MDDEDVPNCNLCNKRKGVLNFRSRLGVIPPLWICHECLPPDAVKLPNGYWVVWVDGECPWCHTSPGMGGQVCIDGKRYDSGCVMAVDPDDLSEGYRLKTKAEHAPVPPPQENVSTIAFLKLKLLGSLDAVQLILIRDRAEAAQLGLGLDLADDAVKAVDELRESIAGTFKLEDPPEADL